MHTHSLPPARLSLSVSLGAVCLDRAPAASGLGFLRWRNNEFSSRAVTCEMFTMLRAMTVSSRSSHGLRLRCKPQGAQPSQRSCSKRHHATLSFLHLFLQSLFLLECLEHLRFDYLEAEWQNQRRRNKKARKHATTKTDVYAAGFIPESS